MRGADDVNSHVVVSLTIHLEPLVAAWPRAEEVFLEDVGQLLMMSQLKLVSKSFVAAFVSTFETSNALMDSVMALQSRPILEIFSALVARKLLVGS